MKKLIFVCLLVSLGLSSCSISNNPATAFYHQHKREQGVKNLAVPGWLVRLGGRIAGASTDDEELKAGMHLVRKLKKVRFMYAEEGIEITPQEIQGFVNKAHHNGFEDLIRVRSEETTVNIMVKDHNEKLKNIIVLVNDGSDFVFLDVKSNISYEFLFETINKLIKKESKDWQIERPPAEVKPQKEELAVRPRA